MVNNSTKLKNIKKSLPLPLREGYGWVKRIVSPHQLWENKEFKEYFDFLQKSQWWSLEQLEAYQLEKLQELVKFAYTSVPYYIKSFKENHINPSDIKKLEDIQLLPMITKEIVKNHTDEFIPIGVDKSKLRVWVTGGSSGVPLKVYQNQFHCWLIEESFSLRQRLWSGYKQYDRKVTLTRDAKNHGNRIWDYANKENEILLNSFEMTEKNMFEYVKIIHKFKPVIIVGYPSALEIFGKFLIRNKLSLPKMKGIFCGSETLFPGQRSLIESAYGCKIFSSYGMSERVADATECEQHCGYHVSMEYGILELLDKNDDLITEPGIPGTVVGTGFYNGPMPLIRYQMYDIAEYSGIECACHRKAPLIKDFRGRIREYFVSKSGKLMTLQLIWAGRHPVWSKIQEMQFHQEVKGEVLARIVRAPNYSEEEILKELQSEVGKIMTKDEYDIKFEFVDRLALTHRGKLNILDQKIPLDFVDISNQAI